MPTRPHALAPQKETIRLVFAYRNFAASRGVSHIGLGVSAANTARTLRAHGVWAEVWPITSADELQHRLRAEHASGRAAVSHVILCAPWIPTERLQALTAAFPETRFVLISHSNVGFLMADANGIRLLREAMDLQVGMHNLSVAGNCRRFVQWAGKAWGQAVVWLPNLYDVSTMRAAAARRPWEGGTLRIGCFGATRPLKNAVTAAAAACELAATLKADVEFWVSSGRAEGGGGVENAVRQMVAGAVGVTLMASPWQPWPGFRRVVRQMHLLMQPSFTESFNMVTADGVAEGVASAVSDAIDWVPEQWIARADDAGDLAKTALALLHDPHAVMDGQAALRRYGSAGREEWMNFLMGAA